MTNAFFVNLALNLAFNLELKHVKASCLSGNQISQYYRPRPKEFCLSKDNTSASSRLIQRCSVTCETGLAQHSSYVMTFSNLSAL